jgi:molybdenum cofactor cytidylyltransferase
VSAEAFFDMPVVILAAGQSSRMRGRDKLMEEVDGQPLVRRQAAMARAVTRGAVIVALPPSPHPRHAALAGLAVTALPVRHAAEGMNASLRAGIAALAPGVPCAMVLLGDLPALTGDDLATVAAAVDLTSDTLVWRGATEDGRPGHPIVFRSDLFHRLAALRGDSGGREVVAEAGSRVVTVPLPGGRARRDLDTPEDWAAWRVEG